MVNFILLIFLKNEEWYVCIGIDLGGIKMEVIVFDDVGE